MSVFHSFTAQSIVTLCLVLTGCTHIIHVTPIPPTRSSSPIGHSLHVQVPLLALEGADHMPGIMMLDWSRTDLRHAVTEYARHRQTFAEVNEDQGAFTLNVRAWVWLRSREAYRYIVRLESDLGQTGRPPGKSYAVQKETVGSRIRWVTASDQRPIAEAVQAALDELFDRIEEDAALYGKQ